MHRPLKRWAKLGLLAATVLCGHAALAQDTGYSRPLDVSVNGHLIDWLNNFCTIAITILFIIMVAVMGWAVVMHREGRHKAKYDHGSTLRDLLLIAAVAGGVFVIVDGTMLAKSYKELSEEFWNWPTSPDTVKIEVLGQQWAWNIRYAGPDGKFNTDDDVVTLNDMHIPIGKPVYVKIRSKDVIHSFYLPNFRTKIDAFPGSTTQLWVQAKEGGTFDIGCAQHCGVNHYKMHGSVTAETPEQFNQWLNVSSQDGKRRFDEKDAEAHWGWDWENNNG
jgi:cytochrome c oxidase subunit II